jgi:hypothetical protein
MRQDIDHRQAPRPARIAQIYQYDPRRDDGENGARACRTICRTVACDSDATAVTPRGRLR